MLQPRATDEPSARSGHNRSMEAWNSRFFPSL